MLCPPKPVTVSRQSSVEERKEALRVIYYQVLERQPYQYERKILAKEEQKFLEDKIGVRRFLKELGHSSVYLDSFYHRYSNVKFLEICLKHFLGRAPKDKQEIQYYSQILTTKGVNDLITSILDSEEYRKVFGCFTVPHPQTPKVYESPKSYLESQWLNSEHIGQRGMTVPTQYWHDLGWVCDGGVCHHPEVGEILNPPIPSEIEGLVQKLVKLVDSQQGQEALAAVSRQKLEKLRSVIG